MLDLHSLPKVRDSLSFLYLEHCRVERDNHAIVALSADGRVPIPCASLCTLLLGPGTTITHAAVSALAENGCLVLWCGEGAVRFYAQGMGETRKAKNIMHQARMFSDPELHMKVVRRLYEMRFDYPLDPELTLKQIRGMEGIRVRETYRKASKEYGIPWRGRNYKADNWHDSDAVNRALSAANSCLYGVCQAAIVSAGFSPALGFIHVGKMSSFTYDVADLYKTKVTIPIAFKAVAEDEVNIERSVRICCRDAFLEFRLLDRMIPDIEAALFIGEDIESTRGQKEYDEAVYVPGDLWDSPSSNIEGGVNYGECDR